MLTIVFIHSMLFYAGGLADEACRQAFLTTDRGSQTWAPRWF